MSLYIFRGLPGAGKSKRARELADKLHCTLIEPDAMLYQDDEYRYTPDRYDYAWNTCMRILEAMQESSLKPDVVFADVLPSASDIAEIEAMYGETARKITTLEIDLPTARRRNIHNVSEQDLRMMSELFERIEGPNAVIEDAMDQVTYEPINDMPEGW